jgi:hypothetical protein
MSTLKFNAWLDSEEDKELAEWIEEEVADMECRRSTFIKLVLYREFKREKERNEIRRLLRKD